MSDFAEEIIAAAKAGHEFDRKELIDFSVPEWHNLSTPERLYKLMRAKCMLEAAREKANG